MSRIAGSRFSCFVLAAWVMSAACTTEKIVYREGTNFAAPPASAANFIGYYDAANKRTVCGSCHVDAQTRWASTKHASAWADLQASGAATGVCEACHTVNNLGNTVADTSVGYRTTKDERYHDVQCESCHGPGLTHASSPTSSNRPLASISVAPGATNGCGECHTGVHSPFVDEWKLANEGGLSHSIVQSGTVGNTDKTCVGCHTAQGALEKFGVTSNYAEKAPAASLTTANALPLVCATCHDPHGSATNEHQLRFSIGSMAMRRSPRRCGSRRDPRTSRRAHASRDWTTPPRPRRRPECVVPAPPSEFALADRTPGDPRHSRAVRAGRPVGG